MKKVAKWALTWLLMHPDLLEGWLGPVLSKPKVVKSIKEHGPTIRKVIKMLEKAVK